MLNPANIAALAVPTLVAWSLADDYQQARIKRGLATPKDDPVPPQAVPLERLYTAPIAHPLPTPQPTPQTGPKPLEYRKQKLIAALDSEGAKVLWELRNTTPLRFTGWQRSGKTTKAQTLALLRQLDNLAHPVNVATPHRLTPGDSPWPSSFSVCGQGNQWGQIKATCDGIMNRLANGDTVPVTTILDEFSGYPGNGGMNEGYIQELMLSAIREMAKHNEMLIIIAHGNTAALNGNIKGLNAAMWGNFVTVECSRQMIDGKASPGPEVLISGGGFPESRVSWPQWLTPQWLQKSFPELASIAPATVPPPDQGATQPEPDFTLDLSALMAQDQAVTTDSTPDLPEHLAAVLDYLKRKGTASPRQIQQAKLSVLADNGNNTSGNIQLILDSLLLAGLIQLGTDGNYTALGVGQHPEAT